MILARASFVVIACTLLGGCAGARASLTMPTAAYPVSLTPAMLGPNREILVPEEMKEVGKFHAETTGWGTFYSFIPFTPHLDISDDVNSQVAAAKGQAIVEFRTNSKQCALDYFYILNFIPFWPGCVNVTVDGKIVAYAGPVVPVVVVPVPPPVVVPPPVEVVPAASGTKPKRKT